jgi:hypothetical protein
MYVRTVRTAREALRAKIAFIVAEMCSRGERYMAASGGGSSSDSTAKPHCPLEYELTSSSGGTVTGPLDLLSKLVSGTVFSSTPQQP